jgi:hypothetical protein
MEHPTIKALCAKREIVIPDFMNKIEYSSHVCLGSFILHTQIKSVHI